MKRDWDLIKSILSELQSAAPARTVKSVPIPGYDDATIAEHLEIMIDGGLLVGDVQRLPAGNFLIKIKSVSWIGQEFIDAANKPGIWKKALDYISHNAGTIPFEVLKSWMIAQTT